MKKFFPVLFSLAVLFLWLGFFKGFRLPVSVVGPALADEYDDLQREKEETLKKLSEKKTEEEKTKKKQTGVQSGIRSTEGRIKSVDEEIKDKEEEIKQLDRRKKIKQENLNKTTAARDSLIRLLYKKEKFRPLEVFLSAENLSALSRFLGYYKATSLEKNRQLAILSSSLVEVKLSLKETADRKAELEGSLARLRSQKAGLESDLKSLNSYLNNLTSEISGLEGSIANITAKQEAYIREKLAATAQFTSVGEIEQAKQTLPNPPFSPAFAVVSLGYPHRVGLNQYGAYGRAKAGQSAGDILRAYYAGIELKEDYEVPETIEVIGYGRIPFEDLYLKGIAEMPSAWGDRGGMEALKAQAIAARSYALASTNNGASAICASQACQVYLGRNKGGKWEEAVNGTRKDNKHATVMLFNGQPVRAYYSSTFGGYSRLPTDFDVNWNRGFDFLKRIKDADGGGSAYDGPKYGDSPWYYKAWYSTADGHPWLTKEEMLDLLNSSLLPDSENASLSNPGSGGISFEEVKNRLKSFGKTALTDVSSVQPLFSEEGYTSILRVNTPAGHVDVDGRRFRKVFILRSRGNLALWSSLYDITAR